MTRIMRYFIRANAVIFGCSLFVIAACDQRPSDATIVPRPKNEPVQDSSPAKKEAVEEATTAISIAETADSNTPQKKTDAEPAFRQRSNLQQYGTRFVKIGNDGVPLDADAAYWRCALDEQAGLLWEVKTFDGGTTDADHTYSWYDENAQPSGIRDGGECFFIDCDFASYVDEMNSLELCGQSDWRLPEFAELELLIDRDFYDPTINQQIFPHAKGGGYMTSTEMQNDPAMIMTIDFFNGVSLAGRKDLRYYARLVRRTR